MKILLITPPLLQPNTPYAATPLLTAWLRQNGHDAVQADLSLELLLKLFSKKGVGELCRKLENREEAQAFIDASADYRLTIDNVMEFLQDRDPAAYMRIAVRGWLPEGPHLAHAYRQQEQVGWNFRGLEAEDRARHLASLYLDDIAEAAKLHDPAFGFSRYAEKLSVSLPGFGRIRDALESTDSLFFPGSEAIDNFAEGKITTGGSGSWLEKLTDAQMEKHAPEMVALTVPFPGCLFGALAVARRIRQTHPAVRIVMGGGYVNTELRELRDPAIFDYVDYIVLDSGMLPLLRLANGEKPVRTFVRENGTVRFIEGRGEPIAHDSLPAPVYDGLEMQNYFGMFEMLNPVTRLWSDGRWNKLMLAHGCCWSRCAFCDTTIDYICRYDPAAPGTVCDWMVAVMKETGFNGFHFVDEALPPDLLNGLCDEILQRRLEVEWWGNIRFEKRLSKPLIQKMAAAGCIAVTGGLETCCDRTLKLMRKGITVDGAAEVLGNLADAGIMTHAYLMYGFPTQTLEEIFQALETVRSLFDSGVLHSAFWHRFALTAHSEITRDPGKYSIVVPDPPPADFARNEIPFEENFDYDPETVGEALRAATYNYMHGAALDRPVSQWLEQNF
ncbi:MAG: hypothetical protein K9M45_02220 [Kiritimatiellales bacterium]|nr:hypothetical protein [Kiritimatiellales bacterium]